MTTSGTSLKCISKIPKSFKEGSIYLNLDVDTFKGDQRLSGLEKALETTSKTIKAKELEASSFSRLLPKVYLKALPLRSLDDVDLIKREVKSGNILIFKISPLAKKNVEDVKRAIGELSDFAQVIGGDIARLGEERVVICPSFVKIWRETESKS